MKIKLILLIVIVVMGLAYGQSKEEIIGAATKMADEMIKENVRAFKDTKTGKLYTDLVSVPVNDISSLRLVSEYSDWEYPSGVMNMAMTYLGTVLNEEKYTQYTADNFKFIFKNVPYMKDKPTGSSKWSYPLGRYLTTEELDDCGAMGASLIDVYNKDKNPQYLKYIQKAADHILNKQTRLSDGTLCRVRPVKMSVWADDLFMSVPFLARMGKLSGDNKYYDDAAKQVIQFADYLWDDNTGLYFHCWQSDDSTNGVAHWGRANGWVIVAQIELLKKLPKDYPQRNKLLSILKRQINGIARWQSESGLWHQILDKSDSYLETSCTAMFTYGIAAAVNEGLIPERYISIALQGWKGLAPKTTDDGKIKDVCVGTGIGNDLNFYYNRPAIVQDCHGT